MRKVVLIGMGILLALIVLLKAASVIADNLFQSQAEKQASDLLNNNGGLSKQIVQKEDLADLPGCVQRWLEKSHIVGKERISTVRLKQKGAMRLKPDSAWLPFEAVQYFTVDKPGFVWIARVQMAPFIHFSGRDSYDKGNGRMLIKLLSLVPIVNAQGKEINQGAMLRYLAELQWFPSAALSDYLIWEEIDANSAKVTMTYGGMTASGVFTFDADGNPVKFIASRYRDVNGKYVLQEWGGVGKGFREFGGVKIPDKVDVIWKEPAGDFNWLKCEITEIEYNKTELY